MGQLLITAVVFCVFLMAAQAQEKTVESSGALTGYVSIPSGLASGNFDTASTPVNRHFSPIDIPCGTKVVGLALSGHARLQKIHQPGAAQIGNRARRWDCTMILGEGCTLLTGRNAAMLVKAGATSVYMAKGATAMIHYDSKNNITRVTNVTDHKRDSVDVIFGRHFQQLDPGREIVLVDDRGQEPSMVLTQERLGWRDLHQSRLENKHVFLFRVSAREMIAHCFVYKQLKESPLAVDHHLADELLKSVAALDTMYQLKAQSEYHHISGPDKQEQAAAGARKLSSK